MIRYAVLALLLATGAHGATVQVKITPRLTFEPETVTILAGDTVEFINESAGVHTVTADPTLVKVPENVELPEGAEPFHSGAIRPAGKFSHVFTVAGEYKYTCLPHEKMGMQGHVVVGATE